MSNLEHRYEVRSREERYRGRIFDVVTEEVTMPGGGTGLRDLVRHVGAVAVVALDDAGQVVLIRQYRHPVGRHLWELPAGLMDVSGEELPAAALRELAEEADLTAGRVDVLVDLHSSPGFTNEIVRVFLARDLGDVPADERHERRDEEADLQVVRIDLDEAVAMVLAGEITNASAVAGLLAAARARDTGFAQLRRADAPLPR
ncbi:ADP-ribose diphosphatase [Micromonospora saelicesensis]|uniref:ADP-ribose diphosphatase n=1 Tax=Micromonospora saelicesensis TaxID=285676 RepID=A0A328NPQ4_9ACTN|nr:NUDIX hydrolase [Micromonospora saelicesensis]RAN98276.1 ADP-ribose diphosphatase [Micromonospora saelicesensis]RAO32491.1 ADP-ribose diphosphatase [Micromonospora saelicesensis]RAO45167.1 ADP-ribose diphosphatase [Micromonospora saelicesensis]RAO54542.1 ADP-ribose diphosphatase [Micromonospora saelicesensis]